MIPIALLAALYLLPNLASLAPFRSWLLKSATEGYPINVSAESLSVGWFSPVRLGDVRINGSRGTRLLRSEKVIVNSSLSGLLIDREHLGTIDLHAPVLYLEFDEETSNWRRTVRESLKGAPAEPRDITVAVRIRRGSMRIDDPIAGITETVPSINGLVSYNREGDKRLRGELTAVTERRNGKLSIAGTWPASSPTAKVDNESQATLVLRDTPLSLVTPYLRRIGLTEAVEGRLSGNVRLHRPSMSSPLQLTLEQLHSQQIVLVNSPHLQDRRAAIEDVELNASFTLNASKAIWRNVEFQSRLGSLKATGGVDVAKLAEGEVEGALLPYENRIEGTVDLVTLANQLPRTLALRPGVTVNSGEAEVSLIVRPEDDRLRIRGSGSWKELSVLSGGDLQLLPAARLSLQSRLADPGFVVDSLAGEGEFFQLQGEGDIRQGKFNAEVDLDRLHRELGHLIVLRDIKMAGQASVDAHWSRGEDSNWSGAATARMEDWKLTVGTGTVWTESELELQMNTEGRLQDRRLEKIDRAQLRMRSGDDQALIQLADSVDLSSQPVVFPADFEVRGSARRWRKRLAALVSLPGLDAGGEFQIAGTGVVSETAVSWKEVQGSVQALTVEYGGLGLEEAAGTLRSSAGSYSFVEDLLKLEDFRLDGESFTLQSKEIRAELTQSIPVATGVIEFSGDWRKMSDALVLKPLDQADSQWRAEGQVEGEMVLATKGRGVEGRFNVASINTSIFRGPPPSSRERDSADQQRWQRVWSEPEATLSGRLQMQPSQDTLLLNNISLHSALAEATVEGSIRQLSTSKSAELQGTVEYDLGEITSILLPALAENVEVAGREETEFTLRGPLLPTNEPGGRRGQATVSSAEQPPFVSPDLAGAADLSWGRATLYGLPLGPGRLKATLQDAVVDFSPLDVALPQGTFRADASLLLFRPEATLVVDEGRILNDVEITPAMCRSWLKYLAPLTADATRIRGRLSLDLSAARVAAGAPRRSELQGRLHLRQAQVGPGPLSRATLQIVQGVQEIFLEKAALDLDTDEETVWLDASRQQVPFSLRGERIYHEDMQWNVGPIGVISSGSVGLDGTLALITEIPLRKQWIEDQQGLLASLDGQRLRVPITGTFAEPQVDQTAFGELASETARSAAGSLLEEGLWQGLRSLFGSDVEEPVEPE